MRTLARCVVPVVSGRRINAGKLTAFRQTTLNSYSTIQESIMDLGEPDSSETMEVQNVSKQFFREIISRIRNKVRWPVEPLNAEDLAAFEVYRRDAGEVMITA
jgi:hypothetical protein